MANLLWARLGTEYLQTGDQSAGVSTRTMPRRAPPGWPAGILAVWPIRLAPAVSLWRTGARTGGRPRTASGQSLVPPSGLVPMYAWQEVEPAAKLSPELHLRGVPGAGYGVQ
jgi:hypothetical protein